MTTANFMRATILAVAALSLGACSASQLAQFNIAATNAGKDVQTAVVAAAPVVFKTVCDNYAALDLIFKVSNTDPQKAADEALAVGELKIACDNPPKDLNSTIADIVRGYMLVKLGTSATAAAPAPAVAVAPAPAS